jgi:hypothetical protein
VQTRLVQTLEPQSAATMQELPVAQLLLLPHDGPQTPASQKFEEQSLL